MGSEIHEFYFIALSTALIPLIALLFYLYRLERRVEKLEQQLSLKEKHHEI
ncbi:MAG: hypothetical protein N3A63_01345 [Bacteroidetes bacterium]|nr:hypothetical protein [Bacteroidota bacterium]